MKKRFSHRFLSLGLALMMVFSLTSAASASLVFTGRIPPYVEGDWNFDFSGYLWYTTNTNTTITIDRQGANISNYGANPITAANFKAFNGNGLGNNNQPVGDEFSTYLLEIYEGHRLLYQTPPWAAYHNPSYRKDGSFAQFEQIVGAYVGLGRTKIQSYATYFDTTPAVSGVYAVASEAVPSLMQQEITFEANNLDSVSLNQSYSLNDTRSAESPMVFESRSPRIYSKTDGLAIEMLMTSFANGMVTYAMADSIDLEQAVVTTPVLYVEREVPELTVPLTKNDQSVVSVHLSEANGLASIEDGLAIVDFTATDVEEVPYDMVLISNGKVYDNCSYAYYFDMDTGNFVRGQMVFTDLMADEISADAYLTTSSMFEQYRPDTFTMAR